MIRFSANLGFLWANRPLPDAIRSAKAAGFDAVECHSPYDTPLSELRAALDETGLPLLGLNTRRGDLKDEENGLCALPGREDVAEASIHEALDYAAAAQVDAVHVLAGTAEGEDAHRAFVQNLEIAAEAGAGRNLTILIEPLNRHDAPGYFLKTTDQARKVIEDVGASNLKLMFDCYHVGRTEGDLFTRLRDLLPIVGHIQFASVPDRGPPGQGEIDYRAVFSEIERLGWDRPLGAEYKTHGDTEATLGWMSAFRR